MVICNLGLFICLLAIPIPKNNPITSLYVSTEISNTTLAVAIVRQYLDKQEPYILLSYFKLTDNR